MKFWRVMAAVLLVTAVPACLKLGNVPWRTPGSRSLIGDTKAGSAAEVSGLAAVYGVSPSCYGSIIKAKPNPDNPDARWCGAVLTTKHCVGANPTVELRNSEGGLVSFSGADQIKEVSVITGTDLAVIRLQSTDDVGLNAALSLAGSTPKVGSSMNILGSPSKDPNTQGKAPPVHSATMEFRGNSVGSNLRYTGVDEIGDFPVLELGLPSQGVPNPGCPHAGADDGTPVFNGSAIAGVHGGYGVQDRCQCTAEVKQKELDLIVTIFRQYAREHKKRYPTALGEGFFLSNVCSDLGIADDPSVVKCDGVAAVFERPVLERLRDTNHDFRCFRLAWMRKDKPGPHVWLGLVDHSREISKQHPSPRLGGDGDKAHVLYTFDVWRHGPNFPVETGLGVNDPNLFHGYYAFPMPGKCERLDVLKQVFDVKKNAFGEPRTWWSGLYPHKPVYKNACFTEGWRDASVAEYVSVPPYKSAIELAAQPDDCVPPEPSPSPPPEDQCGEGQTYLYCTDEYGSPFESCCLNTQHCGNSEVHCEGP